MRDMKGDESRTAAQGTGCGENRGPGVSLRSGDHGHTSRHAFVEIKGPRGFREFHRLRGDQFHVAGAVCREGFHGNQGERAGGIGRMTGKQPAFRIADHEGDVGGDAAG